jgi:predicted peptidase
MSRFTAIVCILTIGMPCAAQDTVDGFVARVFKSGRGTMPYRLFMPVGYAPQKRYPLVVWLHGAGGMGHDNLRQISGDQVPGTRIWTTPEHQAKYPAFVLVPQSRGDWADLNHDPLSAPLALVVNLLDTLATEFSIDPQRLYVAGQSNGGYGVWDLITKRSELFAAAVPVCGGGDPARAARVATVPVWAFHGTADKSIPVTASRQMIAAIKRAGGHPRYTEYQGAGHEIWARAFAEPGLVDWVFAQHN